MGIFVFAPVLCVIAFFFIKRLLTDREAARLLKADYLAWFAVLFFLAIASFFAWWGGWGYGPRYLIVLAVPLVYEGLLRISQFDLSRTVFFIVAGYGVLSAWLAKSTLAYMVPDHFLRSEEYSNTLTSILLPEVRAGRFNSNNVLSELLSTSPGTSSLIWIALFMTATISLAAWHRSMLAPATVPAKKKTPPRRPPKACTKGSF